MIEPFKERREISKDIGTITPSIVDELKDDIKQELADQLIELLDAYGRIRWHIEAVGENRFIEAEIELEL